MNLIGNNMARFITNATNRRINLKNIRVIRAVCAFVAFVIKKIRFSKIED
jgi:hypothetical protein